MMDGPIPFLLIVMMWDPSAAQESMDVTLRLMESQERCEEAGKAMAADRIERPDSRWGKSKAFAWRCEEPRYELNLRPARRIP